MKEHFAKIYARHPETYDLLVRREDHAGNLRRAVLERVPLEGADVVELGVGTGRLTRWLIDHARSWTGFDAAAPMLEVARCALEATGAAHWSLAVADHRSLPLEDAVADVGIEGWAFGHLVEGAETPWTAPAEQALDELYRVVRPGGTMALIETLGTGCTEPRPPSDRLAALYEHLEAERGFERVVIRTDYRFASPGEAESLCRFFFGAELADRVRDEALTALPECTGLWWRRV